MTAPERFTVDGYVVEALMPDLVGHDRSPAAFVVYMCLWRMTRGGAKPAMVSHRMLADSTGLAKRSVQAAVKHLEQRRLIEVKRASATAASRVTLTCYWR